MGKLNLVKNSHKRTPKTPRGVPVIVEVKKCRKTETEGQSEGFDYLCRYKYSTEWTWVYTTDVPDELKKAHLESLKEEERRIRDLGSKWYEGAEPETPQRPVVRHATRHSNRAIKRPAFFCESPMSAPHSAPERFRSPPSRPSSSFHSPTRRPRYEQSRNALSQRQKSSTPARRSRNIVPVSPIFTVDAPNISSQIVHMELPTQIRTLDWKSLLEYNSSYFPAPPECFWADLHDETNYLQKSNPFKSYIGLFLAVRDPSHTYVYEEKAPWVVGRIVDVSGPWLRVSPFECEDIHYTRWYSYDDDQLSFLGDKFNKENETTYNRRGQPVYTPPNKSLGTPNRSKEMGEQFWDQLQSVVWKGEQHKLVPKSAFQPRNKEGRPTREVWRNGMACEVFFPDVHNGIFLPAVYTIYTHDNHLLKFFMMIDGPHGRDLYLADSCIFPVGFAARNGISICKPIELGLEGLEKLKWDRHKKDREENEEREARREEEKKKKKQGEHLEKGMADVNIDEEA